MDGTAHRVDRVLGFFSSRPNWDPPTPSPAGECVPLFGSGGDTLACGKGGGGSQFGRGDRHYGTLSIYVLCGAAYVANNGHDFDLEPLFSNKKSRSYLHIMPQATATVTKTKKILSVVLKKSGPRSHFSDQCSRIYLFTFITKRNGSRSFLQLYVIFQVPVP
jgi:hypothetical protein